MATLPRRAIRNAPPNHPPLAVDPDGAPVAVPAGAAGWRLKRATTGRPRVMTTADGRPAQLALETTVEDVLEAFGPGVYRVEAVNEAGQVLGYVTTLHLDDQDDEDDDEPAPPVRLVRARREEATSAAALRHALDTIRDMARDQSHALVSVAQAQADWVKSLAANKALPGPLPGAAPMFVPSTPRNALPANDDDDAHGDDEDDDGTEAEDAEIVEEPAEEPAEPAEPPGKYEVLAKLGEQAINALQMYGMAKAAAPKTPATPAAAPVRNAAPAPVEAEAELVTDNPALAGIAALLPPDERAIFVAWSRQADSAVMDKLRLSLAMGVPAEQLLAMVRGYVAIAREELRKEGVAVPASPPAPPPPNPMLHLAAIEDLLSEREVSFLRAQLRRHGEGLTSELLSLPVEVCARRVREAIATADAERRRRRPAPPVPAIAAPASPVEPEAVPQELPVEVSTEIDNSAAVNFNALAMAVAQHLAPDEIRRVFELVPHLTAERQYELLRVLLPLPPAEAAAWVRANLDALAAELAATPSAE